MQTDCAKNVHKLYQTNYEYFHSVWGDASWVHLLTTWWDTMKFNVSSARKDDIFTAGKRRDESSPPTACDTILLAITIIENSDYTRCCSAAGTPYQYWGPLMAAWVETAAVHPDTQQFLWSMFKIADCHGCRKKGATLRRHSAGFNDQPKPKNLEWTVEKWIDPDKL